jgi:hypothetical protein
MRKKNLLLLIVIPVLSISFTVAADSQSDYQLRRLFDPTDSEYAAEYKGRIHIYDGLTSVQVDDALNKHFPRIDNMMFTRIVQIDEQGEQYVEDDGCD